jgi:8-oxo-dGTP pyrophosphatase MutT (NUDIX family)
VLVDRIAAKLLTDAVVPPADGRKRAAVAVALHADRVVLMKRTERLGDPWSGHISLPGGGYQATDTDLRTTAIRETREELAIDLSGARVLGHFAPLSPRIAGPGGIEVTPFVFALADEPTPVPGPEALSAFWLPLLQAASGALDAQYVYEGSGISFPSWSYEGHVVWGLTWRILSLVIEAGR